MNKSGLVCSLAMAMTFFGENVSSARSFLYDYVPPLDGSDQVDSLPGTISSVPPNVSAGFRSYTVNLQGADHIVQAVLSNLFIPNNDTSWYIYAEMYDQTNGADWRSDVFRVDPGDHVDLSVIRKRSTSSTETYQITAFDRTKGYEGTFTHDGFRPMGTSSTAILMFEWDDQDVSCQSISGFAFSHVRGDEDPQFAVPWAWPQNIVPFAWSSDNAFPAIQDNGDRPHCHYTAPVFYFPSLGWGATEFLAQ